MDDLGPKLFSFAVISDTHVNPDDDTCNSPFPVNARANPRFRHVVGDLNQRDIAFVVHMGDLLHPVPESGLLYTQAAQSYRDITAELSAPIHILPGNHDIGDTPIKGAPASPATQDMIDVWTAAFGPQWHSFTHGDLRFVCLNAQLINSGLPDEAKQAAWAEDILENASERLFLMLHHPPYICSAEEPNHYDNTDAPGRDWVLGLAKTYGVEAMFAGHAHNFWYDRHHQTDYYLCAATSFVRQDYAEMQRHPPPEDSEYGRDDRAKLGYFMVHVHAQGHSVQFVRTYGAERGVGEKPKTATAIAPTPRQNMNPAIGFDLRHNWAEITEIPPSGGLDEFDRKQARNDYPLLALIEMGARNIRIPLADLRDPIRFERLAKLRHLGFQTTLFTFGIPTGTDLALIIAAADRIADWEVTLDWKEFDKILPDIAAAHDATKLPIYISRMRTKKDIADDGVYFHVINHGFTPTDTDLLAELTRRRSAGIVGAVFRIGHLDDVAKTLTQIDKAVAQKGLLASAHLRMGHDNPALAGVTDRRATERIVSGMTTQRRTSNLRIFCDALADNDRGYFPKSGAVDRAGIPNEALDAIRKFHASIS